MKFISGVKYCGSRVDVKVVLLVCCVIFHVDAVYLVFCQLL